MRARWEPALPGSAGSVEPPDISLAEIADRELLCERHVRLLAPLAFVAPRIVAAIADGNAPANLTVTGLANGVVETDLPTAIGLVTATARRYGVGLRRTRASWRASAARSRRSPSGVEGARQSGAMSGFNSEFKWRRQEAMKRGACFPSYRGALMKLRRVMGEHAAAQSNGT